MRSILHVLAAAFLVGLTLSRPSSACSRSRDITEQDDFRNAKYVFHALLLKTELSEDLPISPGNSASHSDFPSLRMVVGDYELKTTVKGSPPQRGRIVSTTGLIGGCALPLLAGQEYIFFVPPWADDAPAGLSKTSLGMVSIFGSFTLTGYEPTTQEELARLRGYATK